MSDSEPDDPEANADDTSPEEKQCANCDLVFSAHVPFEVHHPCPGCGWDVWETPVDPPPPGPLNPIAFLQSAQCMGEGASHGSNMCGGHSLWKEGFRC